MSRPECLPLFSATLGFWPTAHASKRVGEGDLWGQAGHEVRRLRVKQAHTVKKQLRSRWGKDRKRQEGESERERERNSFTEAGCR